MAIKLSAIPSRVLLLDPDSVLADAVQKVLMLNGYACAIASTPMQAAQSLAHDEFDLLVADLDTPGLHEHGTLYAASARHVGAVVMTSNPSLRTAVEGIRAGVLDYIAKPFSYDDLLSRVAAAISKRCTCHRGLGANSDPASTRSSRYADSGDWERLSRREREVVSELVAGLKVGDIAVRMAISENTIRNHLRSVFAKLRVSSQAELIQKLAPMLGSQPLAEAASH